MNSEPTKPVEPVYAPLTKEERRVARREYRQALKWYYEARDDWNVRQMALREALILQMRLEGAHL